MNLGKIIRDRLARTHQHPEVEQRIKTLREHDSKTDRTVQALRARVDAVERKDAPRS